MKIAVFSDSHDQLDYLKRALLSATENGCAQLIHCGDLVAPFILSALAEGFAGPVHIVFGNNDGDRSSLTRRTLKVFPQVIIEGEMAELDIDGKKIFVTHYPRYGQLAAATGQYDLVCYGHDHKKNLIAMGKSLLLNPGNLCGIGGQPSWAVYDTVSGSAKIIDLKI